MSLFAELKRRNVFRVGIAYIVLGWLLLQVTDVVVPILELPDWVTRLVLFLLIIGFPLVLFFAWAFELTPEGVKREKDVDRSQSITSTTGKKLDRAIIGILVVAVALLLFDRFRVSEPDTATGPADSTSEVQGTVQAETKPVAEKSVAVLPFIAMSSGPDDEYFADGLTEEILNALAQLPELLITARTSSFSFKGQDLPVQEIAEKLGVQHIVEGSVRRSGDRLRVTAQLVRAADGFHLWSQNYDSTSDDTIQVQEDIAEKIAVAMDVVMNEEKRSAMREAGLRDVEAFIAMQKARALYQDAHGNEDQIASLRAANVLYEQVLERVPGYPPALEEHSDLYVHLLNSNATEGSLLNLTKEEVDDAHTRMLEDVSLALDNARNFAEQNELEINLSFLSGNWRGITARLQRFIDSSGCTKPSWSPQFVLPFGDAKAYARRIREVTECDPLRSGLWFDEVRAHLWAGDADEALRVARKGMVVAPGGWLPLALNWALIANEEFEELDHAINTHLELREDRLAAQINRLAAMGQADAIPPLISEMEAMPEFIGFFKYMIYAHIGDRETSNRMAARMDQDVQGSQSLISIVYWCKCGAPFDLEATPNFAKDLEEAGFAWPPPSPIKWPLKNW
jgi:TolB-like protein